MRREDLPRDRRGPAGPAPEAGRSPRSEERDRWLAAVVDGTIDTVVTIALDGTIRSWNLAAERLYGYTEAEAAGKTLKLIVPEEEMIRLEEVFAAVQGGAGQRIETARVDREGRRIRLSQSISPILDGRGEVVGLSLVGRDVTEKRQEEELIHAAVESSPNAMVLKDRMGTIVLVNAETERLFGYAREELIGRPVDLLIPAHERTQHASFRDAVLAGQRAFVRREEGELHGLRKDGGEFPIEIGMSRIWTRQGSYILTAFVDITERVGAEEDLAHQAQELARSNAQLEQFAYVASHDLQEPLRMVASYTQLLQRQYAEHLDERAVAYIRFAADGAVRMQGLIEALLDYSRVTTRAAEPSSVDAALALEHAIANLQLSIEETRSTIARGQLPTVLADHNQLVELFQNLVANAIKFRGGDPPRIAVGVRRAGSEWEFSVADNGIGIDPRHFSRIFEVFQRLHTKEEYPGTGIGLAICRRIVERLGGRLWVESSPGIGSTFFFTLPAVLDEAAEPETPNARARSSRGRRAKSRLPRRGA